MNDDRAVEVGRAITRRAFDAGITHFDGLGSRANRQTFCSEAKLGLLTCNRVLNAWLRGEVAQLVEHTANPLDADLGPVDVM